MSGTLGPVLRAEECVHLAAGPSGREVLSRLREYLVETDQIRRATHRFFAVTEPGEDANPDADGTRFLALPAGREPGAGALAGELLGVLNELARGGQGVATRWRFLLYGCLADEREAATLLALVKGLRERVEKAPIHLVASLSLACARGAADEKPCAQGIVDALRDLEGMDAGARPDVFLVDDEPVEGGITLGRPEVVAAQALTGLSACVFEPDASADAQPGLLEAIRARQGFVAVGAAAALFPRRELARRLARRSAAEVFAALATQPVHGAPGYALKEGETAPLDIPDRPAQDAAERVMHAYSAEDLKARVARIVKSEAWKRILDNFGSRRIRQRRYWTWADSVREIRTLIDSLVLGRFESELQSGVLIEVRRFGRSLDEQLDRIMAGTGGRDVALHPVATAQRFLHHVYKGLAAHREAASVDLREASRTRNDERMRVEERYQKALEKLDAVARTVPSTLSLIASTAVYVLLAQLVVSFLVPTTSGAGATPLWYGAAGAVGALLAALLWIPGRIRARHDLIAALRETLQALSEHYRRLEEWRTAESLPLYLNGCMQWLVWSCWPSAYNATLFSQPRLDLEALEKQFRDIYRLPLPRSPLERLPRALRQAADALGEQAQAVSPFSLLERQFPPLGDARKLELEYLGAYRDEEVPRWPAPTEDGAAREARLLRWLERLRLRRGEEPLFGGAGSAADWRLWCDEAEGGRRAIEQAEAAAAHERDGLVEGCLSEVRLRSKVEGLGFPQLRDDLYGAAAPRVRFYPGDVRREGAARQGSFWIVTDRDDPMGPRATSALCAGAGRVVCVVRYETGLTLRSLLDAPEPARRANRFVRAGVAETGGPA